MGNAALAFLSGLGSGVLQGMERNDRLAREKKREQREDEEYEARRQERQDKQAANAALKQAAAPMQAGAGGMSKPEWMDNRDVGLPENAALVNGGLEATATANTPQAVRARQVAALRGFDPERADRLEQSGKSAALTDLQITEAQAAAADRDWRRKLGVAMFAGHSGLADLASKSEFGPLAGKQVRAVPTPDKKSVVYNLVGEDGSLTPLPDFTFSADEAGVAKAGFILDRSITPEARLQAMQLERQREAQAQHQQATLAETSRHNRATEGISREDLSLKREKMNAEKVAPEKAPAGYRFTADGSLQAIPGGPADPATKVGGGKPLTEGQSKALLFGTRMQEANSTLAALEKRGKLFSTPGADMGWGIGAAVNMINSEDAQKLDQAKRDFLNAVLRRESGAVISEQEFVSGAKQYFPQPGDSPAVVAQKRRNRELATRGILEEVPEHQGRVESIRGGAPAGGATGGWGIKEVK